MYKMICNEKKARKSHGFTLAEVLITLSIIGVIASMVIPPLVQDVHDAQFKTAWKQAFAVIDQTTNKVMMAQGTSMKGILNNEQSNEFRDLYLNHLKYIKKCDKGNWQSCWNGNNTDTTVGPDGLTDNSGVILTNGTFILFDYDSNDCTFTNAKGCGRVIVDVNGEKEPNKIGKDVFGAYILENQVVPFGSHDDGQTCDKIKGSAGCSATFLYAK